MTSRSNDDIVVCNGWCHDWWAGDKCQECGPHKWGEACTEDCEFCQDASCDRLTGECQCIYGYTGPQCRQKCHNEWECKKKTFLTPQSLQYEGCHLEYLLLRDGVAPVSTPGIGTIEACLEYCGSMQYILGGMLGETCYCSNNFNISVNYFDCQSRAIKCTDNPYQVCGGGTDQLSVYRTCPVGRYGPDCEAECPAECGGKGCLFNGDCVEACTVGYRTFCTAAQCKQESYILSNNCGTCESKPFCYSDYDYKCVTGRYGDKCQFSCETCENNLCNEDNQHCTLGCHPHFQGERCQDCVVGRWGDGCEKQCGQCNKGACDRSSGTCTLGCLPAHYGATCQPCGHCAGSVCEPQSGNCPNGCQDGYKGIRCDEMIVQECSDRQILTTSHGCYDVCPPGYRVHRPYLGRSINPCISVCPLGFTGVLCKTSCADTSGKVYATVCDDYESLQGCRAFWLDTCYSSPAPNKGEQTSALWTLMLITLLLI